LKSRKVAHVEPESKLYSTVMLSSASTPVVAPEANKPLKATQALFLRSISFHSTLPAMVSVAR
jgi:hypothetical protein